VKNQIDQNKLNKGKSQLSIAKFEGETKKNN